MLPLSGCSACSQQVAGHWSHILYAQHAAGRRGRSAPGRCWGTGKQLCAAPTTVAVSSLGSSSSHPAPCRWMHPAISHLPFSKVYQRSQALPTSTLLPALKAASPGQNPPFFPCTAAGTAEAHAAGKGAAIPACHPDPSQGLRHSSTSSKL